MSDNPTPPAPKEPEKFDLPGGVALTPEMIADLSKVTPARLTAAKADAMKYPELFAYLNAKAVDGK